MLIFPRDFLLVELKSLEFDLEYWEIKNIFSSLAYEYVYWGSHLVDLPGRFGLIMRFFRCLNFFAMSSHLYDNGERGV